MDKKGKIEYLTALKSALSPYDDSMVEDGIMGYCIHEYGRNPQDFSVKPHLAVEKVLAENRFPTDLETVIEFFELFIREGSKDENGIVFTPKYIADYMVSCGLKNLSRWDEKIKIIDPGCGCGIFLVAVVEYLHNRFGIDADKIIENNIYGMDIESCNTRRCKLVLTLLSARYGGHCDSGKLHMKCLDSLKTDWASEWELDSFDYIFGNPPYVNPHDMAKETAAFLRSAFETTKSGTFNIFYAFIEQAMSFLSAKGRLVFIVPNNFLSIKSAAGLRGYLQEGRYLAGILDFGENMVFRPVRTYSCILTLDKEANRDRFCYCVLNRTMDIEKALSTVRFASMPIDRLDPNGWNLVNTKTQRNLEKIESNPIRIKKFIRTGIATLRDQVYFAERDSRGYFKEMDGERIFLDSELVKPIYKISELRLNVSLSDALRYIIFPYRKQEGGYTLIPEEELRGRYPDTYRYLCSQRKELDKRDKGKRNPFGWYAYGRTQGLNRYGRKLLYPTFSNRPRFTYVDSEETLFCNGYAVFENEQFDLDVLCKLLNSVIMDYYVRNTSYPIEGGYYCYQKKYIENLSFPEFSHDELERIRMAGMNELNEFLIEKYGLDL